MKRKVNGQAAPSNGPSVAFSTVPGCSRVRGASERRVRAASGSISADGSTPSSVELGWAWADTLSSSPPPAPRTGSRASGRARSTIRSSATGCVASKPCTLRLSPSAWRATAAGSEKAPDGSVTEGLHSIVCRRMPRRRPCQGSRQSRAGADFEKLRPPQDIILERLASPHPGMSRSPKTIRRIGAAVGPSLKLGSKAFASVRCCVRLGRQVWREREVWGWRSVSRRAGGRGSA